MKIIANLFTAFLQLIAGYLFLFIGTFFGLGGLLTNLGWVSAENPDPWWNTPLTFLAFALTASTGVWLVGWLAAKIRKMPFAPAQIWWRTFAVSAFGILIVERLYRVLGAVGMLPVFVAVVGALLGFYIKPKALK